MARYEARYDDELGNMVYDTNKKDFLTADDLADRLNAHDGMMTRADIERLGDIDRRLPVSSQYQEGLRDGYNHAIRDVLNGGAK